MSENFKKVNAKIIGEDGHVFNLIGICSKALKNNGYYDEASELVKRVTNSRSYDEALQIMLEYVNPISKYDEDFDYMDEYDNFNI